MMKHARLFLACMLWAVIATTLNAQTTPSDALNEGNPIYLMNVGTGLYLKFGGAGNAKAAEGHAGTAITLEQPEDKGGYYIKTNAGYYLDGNLKMTGEATVWTFEKVDAANNYYKIKSNSKCLASQSDAYGLLVLEAQSTNSNKQKWVLLTKAQLFNLIDITPLIPAASFDINDNITAWKLPNNAEIDTASVSSDAAEYYLKITDKADITLNLGNGQPGTYMLSFDARCPSSPSNELPKVTLTCQNTGTITIPASTEWQRHKISVQQKGNNKTINITISTANNSTLYLDNFELQHTDDKKDELEDIEQETQSQYKNTLLEEIANVRNYITTYYNNGLSYFENAIANLETNLNTASFKIETESEFKSILAQINKIKEDTKQEHRELSKGENANNAIFNPGFELKNLNGWITEGSIISREGFTAITGATGSQLFQGNNISQEVKNLPTGKYTLTAKVASTNGANVTLTATHGSQTWESNLQQTTGEMTEIKIENIIIYNGSLLIQVSGDKEFYADDFSLSFKELILHESSTKMFKPTENEYASITMTRNMKAGVWNTFVVPFDMAKPAGWEVKTLTGSTLNNENISLTFSDASSIEAGKPYMVRVSEAVTEITLENVNLSTTLNNTTTDHVEFTGVYTSGNVPAGAFFISSNTFYRAADNSNTMKAFRAYIKINDNVPQSARSLSYRTDGKTTAIDNSQLTNDNEPTVVAIYNLQGVRLDDMQEGINILQMSNGSIIKVMIK